MSSLPSTAFARVFRSPVSRPFPFSPFEPTPRSEVPAYAKAIARRLSLVTPPARSTPIERRLASGPLPTFPADNWWNLDVSSAPVDARSGDFISYINHGGSRRLHPDFGGEVSPGSTSIYGLPYVVTDGTDALQAVTFQYWNESDGVDRATGEGVPFYPIPQHVIDDPHWIEGGAPASVDQRGASERHLIIVDRVHRRLYELSHVWYDVAESQWHARSGACFEMDASERRPDGWKSADAAGLAMFPGLVRYDETMSDDVGDIRHAFRVSVRASDGYVFPASRRAGSTSGALPLGARLRLKRDVNGSNPALRSSDPHVRKIFRAMQRYGLIVADHGSDMIVSGAYDARWDNDTLSPAFALLTASDFEVLQLGWNPAPTGPAMLSAIAARPNPIEGGQTAVGSVTLTKEAPAGGAAVTLTATGANVAMPDGVIIPEGSLSATFPVITSAVDATCKVTLAASYAGMVKSHVLTVQPSTQAEDTELESLAVSFQCE